jgi:hypothetical protein
VIISSSKTLSEGVVDDLLDADEPVEHEGSTGRREITK